VAATSGHGGNVGFQGLVRRLIAADPSSRRRSLLRLKFESEQHVLCGNAPKMRALSANRSDENEVKI